MLIQAEAGLVSITGTPDTAVKTGIPTSDIAAGMSAAQSALAALLRRCRTGEGATIDVAMLDTTVEWMGHALYTQMHTGAQSPRMGLSHSSIAPYRRVQHRTIAGPYGPHRHPLHPRRRRSAHPDPHRPGRLRRYVIRSPGPYPRVVVRAGRPVSGARKHASALIIAGWPHPGGELSRRQPTAVDVDDLSGDVAGCLRQ